MNASTMPLVNVSMTSLKYKARMNATAISTRLPRRTNLRKSDRNSRTCPSLFCEVTRGRRLCGKLVSRERRTSSDGRQMRSRSGSMRSMAWSIESLPLPEDPTLAVWASVLNEAGYWAYVFDASWCLVFVTDDLRLAIRDTGPTTTAPIGSHIMSAESRRWQRAKVG